MPRGPVYPQRAQRSLRMEEPLRERLAAYARERRLTENRAICDLLEKALGQADRGRTSLSDSGEK